MPNLRSYANVSAVLCTLGPMLPGAPSFAQGADTSTGLTQSRRGGPSDEAKGGARAVHAGAGTTDASTTGRSGSTAQESEARGEINLPALPDRSLCDAYRNGPFFDGCLGVALSQNARTPK